MQPYSSSSGSNSVINTSDDLTSIAKEKLKILIQEGNIEAIKLALELEPKKYEYEVTC